MLDGKAFEQDGKPFSSIGCKTTGQLSFLLGQPLRPVRIFGFRSNPSEAELPFNQKCILLAVGTFAAECRLILAPCSHHGFTKPIGDSLAKLLLDDPSVPSRGPASPALYAQPPATDCRAIFWARSTAKTASGSRAISRQNIIQLACAFAARRSACLMRFAFAASIRRSSAFSSCGFKRLSMIVVARHRDEF